MLSHLLYLSRSRLDWTPEDLEPLVASARRHNEQDGVTGLLLYGRGHFLQLLEARRQPLVLTFDRIARDSRHTDVRVLLDGPIPNRLFEGWAMGVLNVDTAGQIDRERFDRLVSAFGSTATPAPANARALELLWDFKAHASHRTPLKLPDFS